MASLVAGALTAYHLLTAMAAARRAGSAALHQQHAQLVDRIVGEIE